MDVNKIYSVTDSSDVIVRSFNANLKRFPYFQNVSYSSDGKHLIAVGGSWHLSHFDGTNLEIWAMNLDGSQGQQLTDNQLWESDPVWNSKANKIAFTRLSLDLYNDHANNRGSDLFVKNADGTKEIQLTHNRRAPEAVNQFFRTVSKLQFSPDGTKIAFNMMNSRNSNLGLTQAQRELFYRNWIYIIDTSGRQQKRLVEGSLK